MPLKHHPKLVKVKEHCPLKIIMDKTQTCFNSSSASGKTYYFVYKDSKHISLQICS